MPEGGEGCNLQEQEFQRETEHFRESMRESGVDICELENPGTVTEVFSEPDNFVSEGDEETESLREHKFPDPAQTGNQEQEHNEENQPVETLHDRRSHQDRGGSQVIY